MKGPLVSILMNCYNGAPFLREAIDSVIAQTHQNWELIFWDNQSTDDSAAICQSYLDPRIKYFRAPRHTDLGQARVEAVRHLSGEFVAVLDTDDLWLPRKLELQLPLFASPQVGIVISDTIFFNAAGNERQLYKLGAPPQGRVFHQLATRYFVSLETVLLRHSAMLALDHIFDAEMGPITDFDLLVRLGRDWELACVPEVLARYRVHEHSLSWTEPGRQNEAKRLFASKMDARFPAPDSEWQRARHGFLRGVAMTSAIANFLAGRRRECRQDLSAFVTDEWRAAALYCASWLPFSTRLVLAYLRMRTLGYAQKA